MTNAACGQVSPTGPASRSAPFLFRAVLGHHLVYDEKATQDAQQRADAFMAAQTK